MDLEEEAAKTQEGEAAEGKVWWVKVKEQEEEQEDELMQGFFDLEESSESFMLAQMTGTAAETIALALKVEEEGARRGG